MAGKCCSMHTLSSLTPRSGSSAAFSGEILIVALGMQV
jgi:hypothetical protein